jgi:hypothetical protein
MTMARLQILELPSTTDEMYPFALVVDCASGEEANMCQAQWRTFGKEIGARSVLINGRALDVPRTPTVSEPEAGADLDRAVVDAVRRVLPGEIAHQCRVQGVTLADLLR